MKILFHFSSLKIISEPLNEKVKSNFESSAEKFDRIYDPSEKKSIFSRWLDKWFRKTMYFRFEETLKNIDNEQKKETKVIETEIKKVLNEDTPWILADGSFDENFDPSTLDGRTYERDTPRGRYQLDKQKHLQGEFLGNISSTWNWLTGKEEIDSTEDKKNIKNIKNIK